MYQSSLAVFSFDSLPAEVFHGIVPCVVPIYWESTAGYMASLKVSPQNHYEI